MSKEPGLCLRVYLFQEIGIRLMQWMQPGDELRMQTDPEENSSTFQLRVPHIRGGGFHVITVTINHHTDDALLGDDVAQPVIEEFRQHLAKRGIARD